MLGLEVETSLLEGLLTESQPGPCEAVDRSLAGPLGGADELVAHLHCSEVRSSDVDV